MDHSRQGSRILVAEDNPLNRRLISKVLTGMGRQARMVENGLEALEALAAEPFSLILMDIGMPVMDGLEATRRIRAGEIAAADPDIPILALTAHYDAEDRQRCLDAGMTEHLAKPLDVAELRRTILRLAPPESPGRP